MIVYSGLVCFFLHQR